MHRRDGKGNAQSNTGSNILCPIAGIKQKQPVGHSLITGPMATIARQGGTQHMKKSVSPKSSTFSPDFTVRAVLHAKPYLTGRQ